VKACSLFEDGHLVSVLYQDVAPVMRENLFLAATEFYINTAVHASSLARWSMDFE